MMALRQITAHLVEGAYTDLAEAVNYLWQAIDVNPRYVLALGSGKYASGVVQLAASGGNHALALPSDYNAANRLFACVRSDKTIKAVTVSPAEPTSTVLIKAGTSQGGLWSQAARTTSITLTNPQTTVAKVEYFVFELPDITLSSAWRDGVMALGVQTA